MDNRNTICSVKRTKGVICNFHDASGVSRARCSVCGCPEQPNWKDNNFLSAHVSDVLPTKTKAL